MSRTRMLLLLALLFPTTTLPAQRAAEAPKTDVPVKTVMLFSSGVGYFEHAGTVRGNSATELRFKTAQINDILKSLVLQDDDGGKVSAITYASKDPLAKTLRSFQVNITNNPSLADLLNQLRGARVTVQHAGTPLSGTILGVETRQKAVPNSNVVDVPVLNVLSGASIRAIELQSVTSLTLDDPELQAELTRALGAVGGARDQDKKPVTINFTGNGDRHVRIGYVVETPIWKTSYRLLLDGKSAHLQGWAIVENQTETDWTGVSLSLVSGRPMSFMMDLYQPLYVARPLVTQELFAGLRPQMYDGGTADSVAVVPMQSQDFSGRGVAGGIAAGAGGGRGAGNGPAPAAQRLGFTTASIPETPNEAQLGNLAAMAKSVEAVASAARMGELFQYVIPNVTLARQKSAMLPIVTDTIGIDRLSIYNASVLRTNPLNGIRIRNSTGKHLLQGPVTVLDDDHYAGDARVDNVPPGQERLLSYGIDLEMTVDNTKNTSQSELVTARANNGLVTVDRKTVASIEYLATNKSDKAKTLVIEHPIRGGWKLSSTQKPVETTPALYRFQGVAEPHKTTSLVVSEELLRSESYAMVNADTLQLLVFSRDGHIPPAVRNAMTRVVALRQAMATTNRLIEANRRQIESISADQNRMRENMKTVGQSNDYYKRLLAKLNEQESSIERLQHDTEQLQAKYNTQRKELEDYVSALDVS